MSMGIISALQTVCLPLVLSCGIQEHSSNLIFSGTEVCLSQDSNECSWNTFPLFTQLWNTLKTKNVSEHDDTSGSSEFHKALMWKWQILNIYKISCSGLWIWTEEGPLKHSGAHDLITRWLIANCVDNSCLLKLFSSWCLKIPSEDPVQIIHKLQIQSNTIQIHGITLDSQ